MRPDINLIQRFLPGQDGREFRLRTFNALAVKYRPLILGALEILHGLEFEFPSVAKAHAEQLRPDLIFRHSLPFCITEDLFFEVEPKSSHVLAALLAGHTLALTHLDYHLDGSSPDPNASATALQLDPATAVAYSVRMIYAAGKILGEVNEADRLFREVLDPVSGFVVLRMHEDWRERYSDAFLGGTQEQLHEYLYSSNSRLLASGYWEAMVRGSFASHASSPPTELLRIVRELRRLRQIVDETADFDEDLRAGLVTTPLLIALQSDKEKEYLSTAVRRLWSSRETTEGKVDEALLAEIRSLVVSAGGFDGSSRMGHTIWENGIELCSRELGNRAGPYMALFDLKRAKLAQLASNSWQNQKTDIIFI